MRNCLLFLYFISNNKDLCMLHLYHQNGQRTGEQKADTAQTQSPSRRGETRSHRSLPNKYSNISSSSSPKGTSSHLSKQQNVGIRGKPRPFEYCCIQGDIWAQDIWAQDTQNARQNNSKQCHSQNVKDTYIRPFPCIWCDPCKSRWITVGDGRLLYT